MTCVVKVYDPLGSVPASCRSARNTWVISPTAEPLRLFATELAARAFIALQGPFTALEMCVEAPLAR
jgi:hypothetical protein